MYVSTLQNRYVGQIYCMWSVCYKHMKYGYNCANSPKDELSV